MVKLTINEERCKGCGLCVRVVYKNKINRAKSVAEKNMFIDY